MPSAKETFDSAIKDAEELLAHFDRLNAHPPPPNAEVLKRAGLIMALTAWETYVEDRLVEAVKVRLGEDDSFQNQYVLRNLENSLKSFNTPDVAKTNKLFHEFLGIDLASRWHWNNYDCEKAKTELNALVKKRGEAVHRSRAASAVTNPPHLVKRDELDRTIRFVKCLVETTEKATVISSCRFSRK